MKGMTCIKCRRKVVKEEITLKTLQYTFYSLWGLLHPCMNNTNNNYL